MRRKTTRSLFHALVVISALAFAYPVSASQTPEGQPLELPCVTDVTVEILGQAAPESGNGQALVAARLTIAPGGGFDAHTHPGTLTVWVDTGTLAFTLLDDVEMTVNRAPVDGDAATTEPVVIDEELVLNPGDWFVEEGMVHTAWNRGEEPTVVILSGLVDPELPLVQCVEDSAGM